VKRREKQEDAEAAMRARYSRPPRSWRGRDEREWRLNLPFPVPKRQFCTDLDIRIAFSEVRKTPARSKRRAPA